LVFIREGIERNIGDGATHCFHDNFFIFYGDEFDFYGFAFFIGERVLILSNRMCGEKPE